MSSAWNTYVINNFVGICQFYRHHNGKLSSPFWGDVLDIANKQHMNKWHVFSVWPTEKWANSAERISKPHSKFLLNLKIHGCIHDKTVPIPWIIHWDRNFLLDSRLCTIRLVHFVHLIIAILLRSKKWVSLMIESHICERRQKFV